MKLLTFIVSILVLIQPLSGQILISTDQNGRNEEQLARKKEIKEVGPVTATSRNADEVVPEGHDKDEGVYETSGALKKQLEENGLIPASGVADILDRLSSLEAELKQLKLDNDQLLVENNSVRRSLGSCCNDNLPGEDPSLKAFLLQNSPNPFNEKTDVRFFLPLQVENARILIRDLTGEILKTYEVQQRGQGYISLEKNDLPSGSYIYSLYVNDNIIDSKVMILTR